MFQKQTLSLNSTSLFSGLFSDYVNKAKAVEGFYESRFDKNSIENFLQKNPFETTDRKTLVQVLTQQANVVSNTSSQSKSNIALLEKSTTFTVTTGHQLCLFTGPSYFIYKIISAINLAEELKKQFPDKHFVPVYWMASEDHDFDEINHTHVFGKAVVWNSNEKGSVGEFSTSGLQSVVEELKTILGNHENAQYLISVFEKAYLGHNNLADATRYIVNALLGEYGIVILDGNNKDLKSLFKEEFKADIFKNKSFQLATKTIEELKQLNYNIQVNPREINVFYKDKGLRERIEFTNGKYNVVNTEINFSKEGLAQLIETSPDKLSPNVVLRPLYQQKILPNIAYVGGPGELAYWLEYKAMFEAYKITFPILLPRHFVMLVDKNTQLKLQKLNFSLNDIFRDGEELVKRHIKTQHADVHLENEKQQLAELFANVSNIISDIDKTLVGATEAEKQKALNGLNTIEQKINRALKQKSETEVNQIWGIKSKLFPNNTPQERWDNFSMYYAKYGINYINELKQALIYDLTALEYVILLEN